jgi:hypothetical protein
MYFTCSLVSSMKEIVQVCVQNQQVSDKIAVTKMYLKQAILFCTNPRKAWQEFLPRET